MRYSIDPMTAGHITTTGKHPPRKRTPRSRQSPEDTTPGYKTNQFAVAVGDAEATYIP